MRDLLMHQAPKDFDISTNARPEEVKRLFRHCLLIGRRFRLAHVRFGKQIIEVSTFRAGDGEEEGLIVRDNRWGTAEEDVLRRDFTINGLFYDPREHAVIDYVGGCADLNRHLLRSIGDPKIRFKQDPVRMLRLLKFVARLGFSVEKETLEALYTCREEIRKSAPARLQEELFRMLESGFSETFFRLMSETQLLDPLFPHLAQHFAAESATAFHYLTALDLVRKKKGTPLPRSVLTASLIFPLFERRVQEQEGVATVEQLQTFAHEILLSHLESRFSHFPRKTLAEAQSILALQYRLTPQDKKKNLRVRLIHHPDFPLALLFLRLRALLDSKLLDYYVEWKRLARG